jgi:hypothetical protein
MSINSKVVSNQIISFPKLMIKWSDGTIWLFSRPKEGTLIWGDGKIGAHLTSLCMTDFNDFTGVVHLSNNGD